MIHFNRIFSLSLFTGILLIITISGCSVFNAGLNVEYHNSDSTKFEILPIKFSEKENGDNLSASFLYYSPVKGRTEISCTFSIKNDQERFVVSNAGIYTSEVNYSASTFDMDPVVVKKEDVYEHNLTFFVPELDFVKMLNAKQVELKVNNSSYIISQKKWDKVRKGIEEKQLMQESGF